MITINLLQTETRSKAAASIGEPSQASGGVLVAVVLLAVFGLAGGLLAYFYLDLARVQNEQAEIRQERNSLRAERDALEEEYETLREALETLRNQDRMLAILDPEDRLYWAEKLNILPMYVPDGVFLTRIRVTEQVQEVETPESRQAYEAWERQRRRGTREDPPRRVMVPVIRQTLELDGVAYEPDGTSADRLSKIIAFYNALENDRVELPFSGEEVSFMDNMSSPITYRPFTESAVQGREVTEFRFVIQSRPPAVPPATRDRDGRGTEPGATTPARGGRS